MAYIRGVSIVVNAGVLVLADIIALVLGVAVKDGGQLLPGDKIVRPKVSVTVALHDVVCSCPVDGVSEPCVGIYVLIWASRIYRRMALAVVKNLYHHGPGEIIVRPKDAASISYYETSFQAVVDTIVVPGRSAGICVGPDGQISSRGQSEQPGTVATNTALIRTLLAGMINV